MLIQYASDLHLDFVHRKGDARVSNIFPKTGVNSPDETGADVLVLAGDIAGDTEAIEYFKDYTIPVILILGNHEHYHGVVHDVIERTKNGCKGTSISFLENDSVIIKGVRFIGATLWTDCEVGRGPEKNNEYLIERSINDYKVIRTRQPNGAESILKTKDTIAWHKESVRYIDGMLDVYHDGPSVVVTHHLPSESCVSPKYKGSPINGAFASNLDSIFTRKRAELWIHGHTHDCVDTKVNGTRIVCNPRGYPLRLLSDYVNDFNEIAFENPCFNPSATVSV